MEKDVLSKLGTCLLVGSFAFMSLASGSSDKQNGNGNGNGNGSETTAKQTTEATTTETTQDLSDGFGKTIIFDNMEITFADSYNVTTVDNQFSEYNGQDIIEIPIHVKNVGSDNNMLNIFFVTIFGSQGTEVDELGAYFDDTGLFGAGELRPGAEKDLALYFSYDGDGTYYANFDRYSEEIEVGFNISK